MARKSFGREVKKQTMELSARDRRILADIECASALEDPRWTRRVERLARRKALPHTPVTRRRQFLAASVLFTWLTLLVIGAVALLPLLWTVLTVGVLACAAWTVRRRRIYGYWFPRRRRIARIPRQGGRS